MKVKKLTRSFIEISEKNIIHNINEIKKINNNKILAMIKGDAYGHGLYNIVKIFSRNLNLIDYIGIADLQEALLVRKDIKNIPIFLTYGFWDNNHFKILKKLNVTPIIHSMYQYDLMLENNISHFNNTILLKVNTGMNRLGLRLDELIYIINKIANDVNIIIISHFSNAKNLNNQNTIKQTSLNETIYSIFKSSKNIEYSFANSDAIINNLSNIGNIIRPGILLYGGVNYSDNRFKSVMSFKARIIAINKVFKNETVGYDECWKATRDSSIAIISAGYADGYPQNAPNGTPVLINNTMCKLVGKVSMDMITVDITDMHNEVSVGDYAELWSEKNNSKRVANFIGISMYSLLCGISKRVRSLVI